MRSPSFLTKTIKISMICVGLGFSGQALAEYYIVYPDGMGAGCCRSACSAPCSGVTVYNYSVQRYPTPYYEMHFKSPRAHSDRGSGEMAEYAWIPTP